MTLSFTVHPVFRALIPDVPLLYVQHLVTEGLHPPANQATSLGHKGLVK